jgi:metal transporter CNNM
MNSELLAWIGIAALTAQSGILSGLNLALFGVSAMRLKVIANTGDKTAAAVLALREDSNFLLTTIL